MLVCQSRYTIFNTLLNVKGKICLHYMRVTDLSIHRAVMY